MPPLGINMPPQTRALQLPRGESLKAEPRWNDDGTPFYVVKLYNGTGSALTANRPYLVTYAGTSTTVANPRVTALADTGDVPQTLVVAMEAVADASWGWFAFAGYVECGVEGTTDVTAGDYLLVSSGVSTSGLVKDGTTRSKRTCAIACEGQTSNAVVTTRVYLPGDPFSVSATETVTTLSLADGSASTPSLTFANDPNTGIYSAGVDLLGFAAGGSLVAHFAGDKLQMAEAKNISFGTTTGTKLGSATSQKLGFWNATPIVQPSGGTQTFSTADSTHAARTSGALTLADGAGTNDGTIGAITADASVIAAVQELADQIGKNRADLADTAAYLNYIVDQIQTTGLLA